MGYYGDGNYGDGLYGGGEPLFSGRDVLIKVDLNNVGGSGANWTTIAQQRGGGAVRATELFDATTVGDGWGRAKAHRMAWTLACDGALDATDAAWAFILARYRAQARVWVMTDFSAVCVTDDAQHEGRAWVSNLEYTAPEADVVSFAMELTGDGALSRVA